MGSGSVLCQSYLRDVLGDIIPVGKLHGRCTYMVKPPDGFIKYRIQEWWKGSQAGAPKWWSCQWQVCGRRGLVVPVARASGCTYMAEPLP